MTALAAGTKAPDIELKTMDGKRFSLQAELARGPVVLIFFKASCPTCQYALPMFERLHKAYGQKNVSLVGVSQNDSSQTAAFMKQFGISFPVLLDDTRSYPASNAYGLTNVPPGSLHISTLRCALSHDLALKNPPPWRALIFVRC